MCGRQDDEAKPDTIASTTTGKSCSTWYRAAREGENASTSLDLAPIGVRFRVRCPDYPYVLAAIMA
jgi:hypothetical protein